MIDKNASRQLLHFLQQFSDLQEKHLVGVHDTMRETVDGIMDNIQKISERTKSKSDAAHAALMKTYTQPDIDTQIVIKDTQHEIDRIVEGGHDQKSDLDSHRHKLLQSTGHFSKQIEQMASLDSDVQEVLLAMMGQLSRDDVIKQRIEHVIMCLRTLQTDLTYLLQDFENRCSEAEINHFIQNMKSYALRIYTMQEERSKHYEVFPEDKVLKKKRA